MKDLKTLYLDKIGITASTACAIHCAAMPFVLTSLPFWGLAFLADPMFELVMILISLTLGIWSLGKSYNSVHQNARPIIILVLGFILISTGHVSEIESLEAIFIPIGGCCIAIAHFINLKLSRNCKHDHE